MNKMSVSLVALLLSGTLAFAQEYDFGDLPAPYPTTLPNGARHLVTQALYMGTIVPDLESDGQPTPTANGDDVNTAPDEDGINPASLRITAGVPYNLRVKVTNALIGNAWLHGFADWNHDGDFNDAGESTKVMVPGGSSGLLAVLSFNVPASANTTSLTALRLRLASDSALQAFGPAQDGEVEDWFIDVKQPGGWKDFGDLPDSGAGTSAGIFFTGTPPNYKTLAADGGPSHGIVPGLNFANDTGSVDVAVDADLDGQPTPNVNGDDNNGDNDELGLLLATTSLIFVPDGPGSYFELEQNASLAVQNVTGTQARVAAFIDVNSDGDFNDVDEQAPVILVPGDGSVTSVNVHFKFKVMNFHPAMSFARSYGMRFRITTDASVGSIGAATDGEVMDSVQTMQFAVPNGGYGQLDYGDLPNKDYPTLYAQNGARHVITQTLFMGNVMPDAEADGLPTTPADGDDVNGVDDEDGFNPNVVTAIPGAAVNFPVKCANNTGNPATLYGFVDWNNDGDFQDAGEQSSVGVPTGSAGAIFPLPWNVPATAVSGSSVAVRLRLSTDAGLTPLGRASDGEVEDYFIEISQPMDFGDLPGAYPTTLAANGARHLPSSTIYLGTSAPDVESDGVPSVTASGDDSNGSDDEDAINASSIKAVRGFMFFMPVTVMNNSGSSATLAGFIDWNGDGDFADASETSTKSVATNASSQTIKLEWNVPLTADTSKPIGLRLRLATGGALPPIGAAPNGEVEDFMFTVMDQGIDYGDLPDSSAGTASGVLGTGSPPDYRTRAADGGASHVMKPGLFFYNDGYPTYELAHLDPEPDGQPSTNADGDDNGGEDDEYATFFAITKQTLIPDGTHSEYELEMVVSHAVTNTTGSNANVFCFIDVNSDGDFDDPGEQSVPMVIPTGSANLAILVPFKFRIPAPSVSTNYTVAVRSRISSEASLGGDGPAKDGEVQDDIMSFTVAPPSASTAMDYGDHLASLYPTMWAQNGARHYIKDGIFIGNALPDADVDGHSSAGATGDDASGLDDEDGFDPANVNAYVGFPTTFPVKVTNTTGSPGELVGFVDWNDDGDFADAGEHSNISVPNGTSGVVMNLPFTVPSTASMSAPVAVRLRLSTQIGLGPIGRADDGEVEDYRLTVKRETDFGDLPDSLSGTTPGVLNNYSTISQADYRTRLADGGPWHYIRPDLALFNDGDPTGVHTDGESDGHPSAGADGDNNDGADDELVLYTQVVSQTASNLTPNSADIHYSLAASLAIKNETGVDAYFTGFLDANNDGDFTDPGETASVIIPSAPGYSAYILTFNPMVHLTNQVTSWTSKMPVRFRLSTVSGLGPDGAAADGEVEDYMITVSFTVGQWWPNIVIDTPRIPGDGTIDIGTPTQLHLVGDFSTASDVKWRIGNTPLTGSTPSLSTSFLQSLGIGQVPYSISGRTGPHTLRSHSGVFDVKNLSTFRTFMGQHSLINETASPDADADGDGRSNFAEFVLGSNPGSQDQPPHSDATIDGSTNSLNFTMPYLRRTGGTENGDTYTTPDAIYAPQGSLDLLNWTQPVTHVAPPSGLPTPPSGYEWGAVRLTGASKGFIRVMVVTP